MNLSIPITKKSVSAAMFTALFLIGVSWVFASGDDPPIVHSCVNNSSGTIKIVQGPDECTGNEAPIAIVTEAGLLDIIAGLAGLRTALDEEVVARVNADAALQEAVDSEVTARGDADAILQAALDAEVIGALRCRC